MLCVAVLRTYSNQQKTSPGVNPAESDLPSYLSPAECDNWLLNPLCNGADGRCTGTLCMNVFF